MVKLTFSIKLFLIIFAVFLLSFLASVVLFHKGGVEKVPDTKLRTDLMTRKVMNDVIANPLNSQSSTFSNTLFDFQIVSPFSGELPWAKEVIRNPSNNYSFVWRLKVLFPAKFFLTLKERSKGGGYCFTLTNSAGLPIYSKTNAATIPSHEIMLEPDIYSLQITSETPLDFFDVHFLSDENRHIDTESINGLSNIKPLRIMLDHFSFKDFKKIVSLAENSKSNEGNVKMPKSRVKGKLIDEKGKEFANVRVGLSGRTEEHLAWFPSINVKVRGGATYNGIPAFKLYRPDTKSGLVDFVYLSILRDMGYPVPRQEVVNLFVNDKKMGVYILMETPSSAMFTNLTLVEGNIIGVDPQKLFYDYPFGGMLDLKKYFALREKTNDKKDRRFLLSKDFSNKLQINPTACYLAFAATYLAIHGIGVDDLRFYENPASNSFTLIPRDLNPGLLMNAATELNFFKTQFGWWTNHTIHTIWPISHLFDARYAYDRNSTTYRQEISTIRYFTDIHFALIPFLEKTENLQKVNEYLNFFAHNATLMQKIKKRLINVHQVVLNEQKNNDFFQGYYNTIAKSPLNTFAGHVNNQLVQKDLFFADGNNVYQWNLRTSLALDKTLMPSFTAPVVLRDARRESHLALAFTLEQELFSILEKNGISVPKKTFHKVQGAVPPDELINLSAITETAPTKTRRFLQGKDAGLADLINDYRLRGEKDVVVYLGELSLSDSEELLIYVVRNATAGKGDYSLQLRDGMTSTPAFINDAIHLNKNADEEFATMEQIMRNVFMAGEPLKLLVFKVPLQEKESFYTFVAPDNHKLLLPPVAYIPTKASDGTVSRKLPEEFIEMNGSFHIMEDAIVQINEHLVLPDSKGLFIHKGAILQFAKGASLKMSGDVHMTGDEEKPIRFVTSGSEKWGGLYITGELFQRVNVHLKHVFFTDYGSWPKTVVGEHALNGGITIENANVSLQNVSFKNAGSEDALNLISSKAYIRDVEVKNVVSDGVDLDFTDALVDGMNVTHSQGDCFDVSHSLVVLKRSQLSNAKDKGLSVGEMSNVHVTTTSFNNNGIGIANKDQSLLHVHSSLFHNNNLAIAEYIKKPYFGKPASMTGNNSYKNNEANYKWLEKSDQ